MIRIKKMPGLKELPKVEGDILGGIATDLMGLDSLLRPVFFSESTGIAPRLPAMPKKDYGFYLKRRKVEFIKVMLVGNVISASYRWDGMVTPERPVPDKPGWVYRAHKSNQSGCWAADIQDPGKFRQWVELCEEYIKRRVGYLDERRNKVIQNRRFKEEQSRIARECHERWKARQFEIESNMYVI